MTARMEVQWALLWSHRQNALHVEPLETTLSANRQAYANDAAGDYRVLFIGPKEVVDAAASAMRKTMADRQSNRMPSQQADE